MIRHLLKVVWSRKRANALVATEILFCFLVVTVVMTLLAAVYAGWNRPLGFQWRNVWVVRISASGASADMMDDSPEMRATIARLMREMKTMPAIVDTGLSETPAYGNATSSGGFLIDGKNVAMTRDEVTDGFANVMQMKPIKGRWFVQADDALSYIPVVIDADLASDYYGDEDPVGKKFDEINNTIYRVVGVVPSYRKTGEFSEPKVNMAFIRKSTEKANGRVPHNLLVRVRPGTPASFEAELTKRMHAVAPEVAFNIEHMEQMRDFTIRSRVIPMTILGIIAAFLISMVALGLSGVLWQTVTRRSPELGLRRALGASGAQVRWQVLAEVALLATAAVAVGLVILLQLPMLGIFALISPGVFTAGIVAALAVIYAITLLCGAYPSWLASTIQPAEALHYE